MPLLACALTALTLVGCPFENSEPPATSIIPGVWTKAFDAKDIGALSSVWGSGPNDVFMVGGQPAQGEVYHFDGVTWRAMRVPAVQFLVWCFGFGPNDVYAVGMGGGAIHFNGANWTALDTGVTESLWGIWGRSPDDIWICGGDTSLTLLHYDGSNFSKLPIPPNDRNAESLYKVWGIGDRIFAVGNFGLILEFTNGAWTQIDAGEDAIEDFISLWGTGDANIVAVGGRVTGRIATYDGRNWSSREFLNAPGLNAVFMDKSRSALCGGVRGYIGIFDPLTGDLTPEETSADLDVHAIWGDGQGRYYAVGGDFSGTFKGQALLRSNEPPAGNPVPPLPVACAQDTDCPVDQRCIAGECRSDAECVTAEDCPTANPCAPAVCNAGLCDVEALDCNDNNPCTNDSCENGECAHTPIDCDDDNPCTMDDCINGVCINTPLCDESEICIEGVCELAPECQTAADCEDNNLCTDNLCINSACSFPVINCNDNDTCTTDICSAGQCQHLEIPDCRCDDESDCPAGSQCVAGVCTPTAAPDIEIGQRGGNNDCSFGPYERLRNGGELDVCQGFQGLGDTFVTLRLSGFNPASNFSVRSYLRMADSSCTPPPSQNTCDPAFYPCVDFKCSPTGDITNSGPAAIDQGNGILVLKDIHLLVNNSIDNLDGLDAMIYIEVFDTANPSIRAASEIPVILFGRALCSPPSIPCPAGQACNPVNYCDHE